VLQGTVELVTFHSEESLYTVLRLSPEAGFDDPRSPSLFRAGRVSAVGAMERPSPGVRLRLYGRWSSHKSHGRQFEFDAHERLPPADAAGVARYLASPAFEGIGERLAQRIVAALGAGALEAIRDQPERLEAISGLKPKVREKLVAAVREEFALHELHAFLRGVGLGPRQAAAVVSQLGSESEALVRRDPYVLAGAVPGLGFGTADRIALQLGLAPDSLERCRAALLQVLKDAAGEGHSLLAEPRLRAGVRSLLETELSEERLDLALEELARERQVAIDGEVLARDEGRAVYLPWLAASEAGLARNVAFLATQGEVRPLADERQLAAAEAESPLELDREQRDAVLGLLRERVALLTGGPGVGKTTIVRLVVALAESEGARVRLASPTGRAAKRLAEATGRSATTLHRLLGFEAKSGAFAHGAERPLQADLVVVDEISMLDVVLAHHLFQALRPPTRVVLVGDPDQLPSVAPGNVLRELIASRRVPVFRLRQIHRQEQGSLIVANAHRILEGREPELPARGARDSDFYFFHEEDPARCAELVADVVTRRIPRNFGLSWVDDVQVLAPMYRGECGVDALNERLRGALGPGPELRQGERIWRVGDRVIHTRNDYEKEIFNGDMGRIVQVHEEGLRVAFPEQEVHYALGELADLSSAFAITVHRAQGSEYEAVVLPLAVQHRLMLQRHLLYTAVTRARRLLVLVGSRRALRMALESDEPGARASGLAARLAALLPQES